MAHWSDCYRIEDEAIIVDVQVQPRVGRTAVIGRHGHALKLRVAAPPVDRRANEAVAELLADLAGIPVKVVSQVSGDTSRQKRFRLAGADPEALERAIETAVAQADDRWQRRR